MKHSLILRATGALCARVPLTWACGLFEHGGRPGPPGAMSRARGACRRRSTLAVPAGIALIAAVTAVAAASPWSSSGGHAGARGHRARASAARTQPAQNACTQGYGNFAAGRWPPACWRPYGPGSPFNTPIPANPRLAPESAAIVSYMVAQRWSFTSGRSGAFLYSANGTRPVYWARGGDPVVRVVCRPGGFCQRGLRLHFPAGAKPQNGSDGHVTVVDQAEGREFDFWRASAPRAGVILAGGASSIPIGAASGSGIGGKGEAAQLGLLGGLIRASELASGRIEHALATTVQCVQWRDVWPSPANGHGDSICRAPVPHFGSLLQLDMSEAEIAATHAPAWEQAIMRAMARYGIYVVDTSGISEPLMSLLEEDDRSFTSFGYPPQMAQLVRSAPGAHTSGGSAVLLGVPIEVSKLRVIDPCVAQHRC